MDRFSNDREALDFIASRIADEAQRVGVPLSEVERKMLYFSETAWTLPDIMEVSDEFESHYDGDVYERKIVQLIKRAIGRARKQQHEEFESWREAVRRLSKDDRYLLVMVQQAGLGATLRPPRPRGDLWKLWTTGCAVVALAAVIFWVLGKYNFDWGKYFLSPKDFLGFVFWAGGLSVAAVYGFLRLLVGKQRTDGMTDRVLEWIFRLPKRGK